MRTTIAIADDAPPKGAGLSGLVRWYAAEVIVGLAVGLLLAATVVVIGACCLAIELGYAAAGATRLARKAWSEVRR